MINPDDAQRLAEIKGREKLGILNADERWLLSRIDSLTSEVARLTAEVAAVKKIAVEILAWGDKAFPQTDAACDYLNDDEGWDSIEALHTELRAVLIGAKP